GRGGGRGRRGGGRDGGRVRLERADVALHVERPHLASLVRSGALVVRSRPLVDGGASREESVRQRLVVSVGRLGGAAAWRYRVVLQRTHLRVGVHLIGDRGE